MKMNPTLSHPDTTAVIKSEFSSEMPASDKVVYELALQVYEEYLASNGHEAGTARQMLLRDLWAQINGHVEIAYIITLIDKNNEIVRSVEGRVEEICGLQQTNAGNLSKVQEKVSAMEGKLGDFSYQAFVAHISSFSNESNFLRESLKLYGERVKDHAEKIRDLASQESVNNLNENFKESKEKFGDSDSGTGFAGRVMREIDSVKKGLGDVTTLSLSNQITTAKSNLQAQIDSSESELKKLLLGPDLSGQSGLIGDIKNLRNENRGIGLWQKILTPVLVNAGILSLTLFTGYASLIGYINSEVKDKIGPSLKAELNTKGGIQSQISELKTAQNETTATLKTNQALLTKISEELGVK